MKVIRLTIILCWNLAQVLSAQNYIQYHNLVNEAEYWLYQGDYKNAEKLYLKAFQLEKPLGKDSYLLAKCYALQQQKKRCYQWLKKSAKTPLSFAPYLLNRADQQEIFKRIFKTKKAFNKVYLELKRLYEETELVYKDSTYYRLQDSMKTLHEEDQKYRVAALENPEYKKFIPENDSIIQQKLLGLIQYYGYPSTLNYGTDKGDVILAHVVFNNTMYHLYDVLLLEEIKKGHLLPFTYAYMVDRWHLITNNSCYLSMPIYTEKLCTASDYKSIIHRRLEIGLSIYFSGQRKNVFEPYSLLPWVTEEFVAKYSFLNKNTTN